MGKKPPRSENASVPPTPQGGSSYVTIRSFASEPEASLAADFLIQKGIKATVGRVSRYKAMSGGGYSLRVPRDQSASARKKLDAVSQEIDMDEYVDADDTRIPRCPSCGTVNIVTTPLQGRDKTLAVLSLGIALLFLPREHHCNKCDHGWTR